MLGKVIVSACALGAVVLVGCSAAPVGEDPAGLVQGAIIGGTTSTGDPAVVQLRADYGGGTFGSCTGTLIAPDVVLTAAHCIDDKPSNVSVWLGTYADQAKASEWRRAKSWKQHPAWPHKYINEGHDCAVLVLEQPVAGVTPKPYSRIAMTSSSLGRSARIVGFGHTNGYSQTGGGTKRTLSTRIVEVSSGIASIGAPGSTSCQGDSGGPMFIDDNGVETVGAISSFGMPNCVGVGSYARTELCAAWIDGFVKQGGPSTCTPSCGGKVCGPDGCGGACGACGATEACVGGACTMPAPPPPRPPVGDACVEHEPNDSFSDAESVCANGRMTGSLSSAEDRDAYTFTVAAGSTYSIRLEDTPSSVNVGLYKVSPSGYDYVGAGEDGPAGRSLVRTTSTGGTYFLSIYRYVSGSPHGESWRVSVNLSK